MPTVSKIGLPGFEERTLTAGGARLRYFGSGGPDGSAARNRPVLLVHGLGGSPANWRRVAPALARDRPVLVAELPGHGASEPLPRGRARDLDAHVEALLALLAAEDAIPAAWVGHSLGGVLALRAAVQRPEAVSAVVLAAAAGISSATRLAESVLTVLAVTRPGRLAGRHTGLFARTRVGRTLAFGWWGVADPAGFEPEAAEAFLVGPPEHTDIRSAGVALVATDPRASLHRVRCPCLCLWGARDNWVPLADGMEYARRLRAPLRVIADCGHLLIGERPDLVAAAIREFLG